MSQPMGLGQYSWALLLPILGFHSINIIEINVNPDFILNYI